jgi:hypothetical protein
MILVSLFPFVQVCRTITTNEKTSEIPFSKLVLHDLVQQIVVGSFASRFQICGPRRPWGIRVLKSRIVAWASPLRRCSSIVCYFGCANIDSVKAVGRRNLVDFPTFRTHDSHDSHWCTSHVMMLILSQLILFTITVHTCRRCHVTLWRQATTCGRRPTEHP